MAKLEMHIRHREEHGTRRIEEGGLGEELESVARLALAVGLEAARAQAHEAPPLARD